MAAVKTMHRYNFSLLRAFLLFLFIIICLSEIAAQSLADKFIVSNYTSFKGLSNKSIYCVLQDHIGFIWMGTQEGLVRFDGSSVKIYMNDPKDSTSLSYDLVSCLIEDRNHTLWIGTRGGGLCKYVREKDDFIRYNFRKDDSSSLSHQQIGCLYEDREGIIWIGTDGGGLDRFEPANGKFRRYNRLLPAAGGLSSLKVTTINETTGNELVLGTWGGGINLFNRKTGLVDAMLDRTRGNKQLAGNDIWKICSFLPDQFWICHFQNGLQYYNAKTNWLFKIPYPGLRENPNVYTVLPQANNELWIATNEGLFHGTYSIKDDKPNLNHDFTKLNKLATLSLMVDNMGSLWASTNDNGVFQIRSRNNFFTPYLINTEGLPISSDNLYINAFAEDKSGKIWIGANYGLFLYDPSTNRISHNYNEESNARILELASGADGSIYAGRDSDISRLNIHSGKLEPFYSLPGSLVQTSNPEFVSMIEGPGNQFSIGTSNGLYTYDRKTGRTDVIIMQNETIKGLSIYEIVSMAVDRSNIVYIATTSGGLIAYDPLTRIKTIYQNDPNNEKTISSDRLNRVYIAHDNILWISTANGINRFNKNENSFSHYKMAEGFPTNNQFSILEDHSGFLWISNSMGISRLNPLNTEVINFFFYETNISNSNFAMGAFRDSKGYMYLGRRGGFIRFNPDSIKVAKRNSRVLISDFRLNDNRLSLGKNAMHRAGDSIESIILNYKQSSFSFDYASLNYISPEKNFYSYMLEPFQNQWVLAGNSTTASYTNIPPGKYIFRVKSTNLDGIVNFQYSNAILIIKPPYWETWWFRILAGFLIITSIFTLYSLRIREIRKENELLEIMVGKRTRELSYVNSILDEQKEELMEQKEELQQQTEDLILKEEILAQNKNELEIQVKERTVELNNAKNKAEESDRLKSAFLANMSHEIRTPLNAIVGFSNLIIDESPGATSGEFYKNIIRTNSDALLVLIDDIIDLSKIEAQQIKLQITSIHVKNLLQELYEQFASPLRENISFLLTDPIGKEELCIFTDSIRFRQIFTNLLSNAFKFTEQGAVEMGALPPMDNEITFYVKDTGIGISDQNLTMIFERFRKVETEEKFFPGAGLGLAISKRMVELLGGKIWVESIQGKGSAFYFTQPLAKKEAAARLEELSPVQKYSKTITNSCIAICEDEDSNFLLLKEFIKNLGHTSMRFKNGKEIVDYFTNNGCNNFSLILMDIKMPVMNGYAASSLIWNMYPGFPIIAQTAYAMPEEQEEMIRHGFLEVLVKPINSEQLIKVINKFGKI